MRANILSLPILGSRSIYRSETPWLILVLQGLLFATISITITQNTAATPPAKVPRTEQDLDPETRRLYHAARERLRQAERQSVQALLDAEKANPLLRRARELESQGRQLTESAQQKLSVLEQKFPPADNDARRQFQDWKSASALKAVHKQFQAMAKQPRDQSLLVWYLRLALRDTRKSPKASPPDLVRLIPPNLEQLDEDQIVKLALKLASRPWVSPDGRTADLRSVEKRISPTDELREAVELQARAEQDLIIGSLYVASEAPATVKAARQRETAIRKELHAIWPRWAEFELERIQQEELKNRPAPVKKPVAPKDKKVTLSTSPQ